MNLAVLILLLIPLLYSLMLALEVGATYSRYAGYLLGKNALGYSLQAATFTLTRFFYVLMMPAIGYIVDKGVEKEFYVTAVVASYVFTAILISSLLFLKARLVSFYSSLILAYQVKGSILRAFHEAMVGGGDAEKNKTPVALPRKINFTLFGVAVLVYTVHAVGVFLSFYFAISYPENRVMISQLSGIINAVGTVLLTFKIDPAISRSMETRAGFEVSFFSVYYARIVVFSFVAPFFTILVYRFF